MKTHVNEGYQKHLGSLRNAQGSFVKASGGVDMGFEKRQLIGHRQGHMLEKFKQLGNLASQDTEQIRYLRKFITTEINKVVEKSRQEKR